MAQQGRQAIK